MILYTPGCEIATPVSPLLSSNPIDFQPGTKAYRQTFEQRNKYFAELPLNTPLVPITEQDITTPIVISGTWKLKFKGVTSPGTVPAYATAAQVQALLESISTIGAGNVEVTGDFTSGYRVEGHHSAHLDMGANLIVGISSMTPAQNIIITHAGREEGNNNPLQAIHIQLNNTAGGSTGAILVKETDRQYIGIGDMVRWDRIYSMIPQDYVEWEAYDYAVQRVQTVRIPWSGTIDVWGHFQGTYRTFTNLAEYSEPLTAKVLYTFRKSNPGPMYIPYRIIHYRDAFGNEIIYAVGTYGVAEGSDAQRWMGDIWKTRNIFVTPY